VVNIVILGCGRVGARLATMMEREGHTVSVIDYSSEAFRRLEPDFSGTTIIGNGVDEEILIRAGIKEADAFAAVNAVYAEAFGDHRPARSTVRTPGHPYPTTGACAFHYSNSYTTAARDRDAARRTQ